MQFEEFAHAHWILKKTNMPNGTNDVAGLLLEILAYNTRQNVIHIISQVPGWNYFTWRIPGIL